MATPSTLPTTAPTSSGSNKGPPVNGSDAVHLHHESSLAPFNPTCDQASETARKMLQLKDTDVLFDLGCGDARMLLHAAAMTPGLLCVGIELDPVFVQRGREALKQLPEDVQRRVDIRQGDLLQLLKDYQEGKEEDATTAKQEEDSTGILGEDCRGLSLFRNATALYMFLLPKGIKKIQPLLNALAQHCGNDNNRNFRVVNYMFSVREWEPTMVDKTTKGDAPIYLYNKFGNNKKDNE
ncbi:Inherit from COG: Methyltransferase [Seminavis robusta]|uniref:Inherit from COG: Methyltransferase n=1 Tax=Seminavis robusta TaxID=568900 RepID=A0A9N8EIP5_9STRA|nr:Inherit from COG: Methyltransferase [Seminavis robusta]|eukprot:Sro1263_g257240.1 Inherit from COG: Methyltransferase (238) ;mRNA; r:18395-19108